ncbi:transcriptional regulator [Methanobacterium sp. ACI-7]|uniref:transcriptional regulator n=1 Tax=unclassified Methanobacterium TaxID=2627676 RepID=UPI0039C270CA
MQRDHVLREISELLANHSFETSHIYGRSCFDMVARKRLLLLLLKVLINIDGFTGPQAEEIKKLSSTFLASPLVVGVKSKHEYLEEDVVYERHGIPVIAPETLRNMIVEEYYPEVFADRGGYFVQVDGEAIKEARERENLSLKDLANKAHVSRETIYKYEHGMVRACPETVINLENILNMKITLSVDIFKIPESEEIKSIDDTPKELAQLGFGIIPTNRTPFDAIAKSDPQLEELKKNIAMITNMEKKRNQKILKKMAINVKDLSGVTGTEAVFIFEQNKNVECIEGVPVVHNWELEEMESSKDLLKVIRERKECS